LRRSGRRLGVIIEWHFQATEAAQALLARHAFMVFVRESCTPESDHEGAEIVFGELVANVVRHAPGAIRITVIADTLGAVTLEVYDTGRGFTPVASLPGEEYSDSGRGIYIVSQLCSTLLSALTKTGNKVSVGLPLVALRPALKLIN
jgi:anti-sigma regulatory factor (Ser/Thr protein kinase)